jgi:hypothetical protein
MRWLALALLATSLSMVACAVVADDAATNSDELKPAQIHDIPADQVDDAELDRENDRNKGRGWLERLAIACGLRYLLLLPLSLLLSVWLIVILTRRESPHARSTLLGLTVLLPLFVGLYSVLDGLANIGEALASPDVLQELPTRVVVGNFISPLVVPVMLSMLLTFVAFIVAHVRVYQLCRGAEQADAADSR